MGLFRTDGWPPADTKRTLPSSDSGQGWLQPFKTSERQTKNPEKKKDTLATTIFGFDAQGKLQTLETVQIVTLDKASGTVTGKKDGESITIKVLTEILAIQQNAKEDPTNRIKAALAVYQELNLSEPIPYPETDQLWTLDPEMVTAGATHLHEIFKDFHIFQLGLTQLMRDTYDQPKGLTELLKHQVLKVFQKGESKGKQFNLLAKKFDTLNPHWQEVNLNSSRNILVIFQQFAQAGQFDGYSTDLDLANDLNMIFKINSALYEVWSQSGAITKDGKARNPLFVGRSYANFLEISQNNEPQEGWNNFLETYKLFMIQNMDTYMVASIPDLNANNIVDAEDLDLREPAVQAALKKIIAKEAERELNKDAYMMVNLIEKLKVVSKHQADQKKKSVTT